MALNHKRMKTNSAHDIEVQDKGSYHFLWSTSEQDGKCIFLNSYPKEFHVAGDNTNEFFDTYDEAMDFALSVIYKTNTDYIISVLNKGIDAMVKSAKNQMHLRLAEFRGNLFSQIQTLKA
jgi:hypothetical protein